MHYYKFIMLSGLFKFFASFGAKTRFENARIQATYSGDYYAPDQNGLSVILSTFSGKDEQTRAQVGISQFFNHLEKGEERRLWNYVLKHLIIIDRCLEERLIVHEIVSYENRYIEAYQGNTSESSTMNCNVGLLMNKLISLYFQYLKYKAAVYGKKKSALNYKKQQRNTYIDKLRIVNIFEQIKQCDKIENLIDSINQAYKNGNKSYGVIQYTFNLLLYTIFTIYSIKFICIATLIKKANIMEIQHLVATKQMIQKFDKVTTKRIIMFVESNKNIEGFKDFKYKEFFKFQNKFVAVIDELIASLMNKRESSAVFAIQNYNPNQYDNELEIIRKSIFQRKQAPPNKHFIPNEIRLKFNLSTNPEAEDPFIAFENGYSQNFEIAREDLLKSSKKSSNSESFVFEKSATKLQYCSRNQQLVEWDKWENIYSQ